MRKNASIKIWLYTIVLMVFAMIFIGGVTRLTDSGLSMVDWKPIMGVIPPLGEDQWNETFNKYKQFPEYKLINHRMNLSEFKSIFFWEYFHRLFGRLIGIAFFIPFLYFFIRKKINRSFAKKLFVGFFLGGMQGLMGWYMVKSGLVNKPDVSHFRLAAHFMLAFLIISYLYWLILEINYEGRKLSLKINETGQRFMMFFVSFFSFIIIIQFLYGAFVAGLDAGLTHNTFPKMGRSWVPLEVINAGFSELYNNSVVVQFIHRLFGYVLLTLALTGIYIRHKIECTLLKKELLYLCMAIFIQFSIGVATLLLLVPVGVASLHQIGGVVILLLLVRVVYFTFTKKKNSI